MFGKEWTEVRQKRASFSHRKLAVFGGRMVRQLGFDILLGKFSGTQTKPLCFFFRFRGGSRFLNKTPGDCYIGMIFIQKK